MIIINSNNDLLEKIHDKYLQSQEAIFVILLAGCSRAGKSTIGSAMQIFFLQRGINFLFVKLDSWLISVEKRKKNSTVSERYDMSAINLSVKELMQGGTVLPPVYDPVSRKRVEGLLGEPLRITNGILLIEGVTALADPALISISDLKIFIQIPDFTRLKRSIDFYKNLKMLNKIEYKKILSDREREETVFVNSTGKNADLLFIPKY